MQLIDKLAWELFKIEYKQLQKNWEDVGDIPDNILIHFINKSYKISEKFLDFKDNEN